METPQSFKRLIYLAMALVSFGALTLALCAQHVWHLPPCKLCLLQRIPYIITMVGGLYGLLNQKHHQQFTKILILCLLLGMGIALYHLGIQYGLIKDRCRSMMTPSSLDDFEMMLATKKGCGEISWKLWGIPLPLVNCLLYFFLSLGVYFLNGGYLSKRTFYRVLLKK